MIGIVDYGIGNLRSVLRALEKVEAKVQLVRSPAEFSGLSGLVLPGVGNFRDCCRSLQASGMWDATRSWALSGKPFFGVCVGYQMLFERSEEAPDTVGLSIFRGEVRRFPDGPLKVPQIGWNQVRKVGSSPMLRGVEDNDYVYFVHTFYVVPADPRLVSLETDYGITFASAIETESVFATQFHPEKSQRVGLQLLRNFAEKAESSPAA